MKGKQRLSASVDAELIAAAERAAASGQVDTVSAWVNDAMRLKLEHDRRLVALAELVADHEAAYGAITRQELAEAAREARRRATSVRGVRAGESRRKYGR
jgi:ABC-type nitrate/sulfonate/bicarbonate transport system substrate-binding protein